MEIFFVRMYIRPSGTGVLCGGWLDIIEAESFIEELAEICTQYINQQNKMTRLKAEGLIENLIVSNLDESEKQNVSRTNWGRRISRELLDNFNASDATTSSFTTKSVRY